MANHMTGAQRHNARQDKIWNKAQDAKSKAIHAKMGNKSKHSEMIADGLRHNFESRK